MHSIFFRCCSYYLFQYTPQLIKFYQSTCDEKKTLEELIKESRLDEDSLEDFVSRFEKRMDAYKCKAKDSKDSVSYSDDSNQVFSMCVVLLGLVAQLKRFCF